MPSKTPIQSEGENKKFSRAFASDMLSAAARRLYHDAPTTQRLLQTYRPYIAPFGRLMVMVPENSSLLDAGCGGGLLVMLLTDAGRLRRAQGFDSNAKTIEVAQIAAKGLLEAGNSTPVSFEYRDATAAWPEGENGRGFDVVSLIDVMHHVPPSAQREVFKTAIMRVRPGGLFLYKDMCRHPRWRAAANRLHDLVLARQWIRYCPIENIDKWAAEADLATIQSLRINMLWYGHELRLYRKPD